MNLDFLLVLFRQMRKPTYLYFSIFLKEMCTAVMTHRESLDFLIWCWASNFLRSSVRYKQIGFWISTTYSGVRQTKRKSLKVYSKLSGLKRKWGIVWQIEWRIILRSVGISRNICPISRSAQEGVIVCSRENFKEVEDSDTTMEKNS